MYQVQQREDLLKEKAGIIITQLGDIMEVPLDQVMDNGDLDKYSIKKVEDIEKQNNQLKDEVRLAEHVFHHRSEYSIHDTALYINY